MTGLDDKGNPVLDPVGANAGVGTTPAFDGKGDIPDKMAIPDLYNRMAHNWFSINMVWTYGGGFSGHVHAGRVCLRRNRTLPGEERVAYVRHELDDLSARLFCILGVWLCHRLGQLVQRAGAAGLVWRPWGRPGGA